MKLRQSDPIRVFIAGGVTSERLRSIYDLDYTCTMVCGLIAHRQYLPLSADEIRIPAWFYDDLGDGTIKKPSTPFHKDYDRCLSALLADPRTFYLVERIYASGGYNTVFNHTIRIEVACWNSMTILSNTRPDRVIFMGITHHPMTWIFGRCVEYLGISTYFTNPSPIPWRYWPVRGIDEQSVVDIGLGANQDNKKDQPSKKTLDFIEINTREYTQAMPSYCSELRERGENIWSWKSQVRQQFAWKPSLLVRNMLRLQRKRSLFLKYKQLSGTYRCDQPFIVFFLHMQHEVSSLPLGYHYVQQWLAVRALATALPSGWTLVVREHPYTFLWNTPIESVRNADFYDSVAVLPQVVLAPLEIDPFELIDSCAAVATLTGTVGFQGLCRGKPVLAFGRAAYFGCPGVFFVNGVDQVRDALKVIQDGQSGPTHEQLCRYLAWVENVSIAGVSEKSSWDGNDIGTISDAKNKVWECLIRLHEEPPTTMFSPT